MPYLHNSGSRGTQQSTTVLCKHYLYHIITANTMAMIVVDISTRSRLNGGKNHTRKSLTFIYINVVILSFVNNIKYLNFKNYTKNIRFI